MARLASVGAQRAAAEPLGHSTAPRWLLPLRGSRAEGDNPLVPQELRLETTQMRQQLGRLRDAWAM